MRNRADRPETRAPRAAGHFGLLALALLLLGCFFAPGASATLYYHPLVGSIGAGGVGSAERFNFPFSGLVAVDPGSGDVYVAANQKKQGEPNFYRFTASGEPAPFTAGPGAGTNKIALVVGSMAVAPPGAPCGTAGDLYASVAGKVEVYSSAGAHIGTIDGSGNPHPGSKVAGAVVVDSAGSLYISYPNSGGHLDKYVPSANPPNNSDFNSELRFEGDFCGGVAIAPSVFYAITNPGLCGEYHGVRSRYPLTFPGGGGSALASPISSVEIQSSVMPSIVSDMFNGGLYVGAERGYELERLGGGQIPLDDGIAQYDEAGHLISFIVTPGTIPTGFAFDATSGQLYVPISTKEEEDVRIYGAGEPVEPPTATIDPVTTFNFRSAQFSGTVNPGGSSKLQETAYRFECRPECSGLQIERTIPGDGVGHIVSDGTSELQPETRYEVLLVARNVATTQNLQVKNSVQFGRAVPSSEEPGEVIATTSFETPAKPAATAPEVTIDPFPECGVEGAHLSGTVDPKGTGELQATSYRFEYSSDGLVWVSGPDQGPIEGEGPQQVSTDLKGLEPNTTYQVRLHAENVGGEAVSAMLYPTCTTAAVAPLVEATGATHILSSSVQLDGRVDPRNSPHTTYYFQYVTQADFNAAGFANATSTSVAPVNPARDEVQTVQISAFNFGVNLTGGTFRLGFGGVYTAPLPYNASAEEVQVALETLSTVGTGNISVAGGFSFYYRVTFTGALADQDVEQLACDATNLLPSHEGRCNPATVSDGVAADAVKPGVVRAVVAGLSPATSYRYRLVATNAAGEATSQDVGFVTEAAAQPCARSGFSAYLSDCRAYEMVSPVDKRGANVIGAPLRTRSAADGEAVSYGAGTSFGDSAGSTVSGVDYMSVRGPDGWSTHALTPFQTPVPLPSGFSSSQYTGEFSGDLEEGIFSGLTPVPGTGGINVAGVANLYLASGMRSGTPRFQLLSDAAAPVPAVLEETVPHISFAGASADFKHVAFETYDNLTANAGGSEEKAYEWSEGEERLVGILPDGACAAPPCVAPTSVIGAGALLGSGASTYTNLAHAISADGSRIFFTAGALTRWKDGYSAGFAGSLYVRIDGQSTVQIDASERSTPDPTGSGRSHFLMATPDGKTVFFLSLEELVNGDTDGGLSLYRYEANAPAGHHLSLVDTAGLQVHHIIAMTPDTGYMYFLGSNGGNDPDVYVKHGSDVRRIAVGPHRVEATNFGGEASPEGHAKRDEARMSADGRRLLFGSNENQGLYAPFNGEITELYLYDYASDQLVCASCSENGTSPISPADFNGNRALWIDLSGPGYNSGINNNTPLTSDGRYVFFTTRDSLVSADTNGHLDVYSYDVEDGKLHLISTGDCNCDSVFLTASSSGRDVFFATHQQLVRIDVDNLSDVYDARIGGGIAAQNAPPPAECQADACLAPPSSPNDATPASAAFHGAGNLAAPKKAKKPLRKKAKKPHKKRHRRHAHKRSHGRKANSKRRAGK
jgi:hypothetical protein